MLFKVLSLEIHNAYFGCVFTVSGSRNKGLLLSEPVVPISLVNLNRFYFKSNHAASLWQTAVFVGCRNGEIELGMTMSPDVIYLTAITCVTNIIINFVVYSFSSFIIIFWVSFADKRACDYPASVQWRLRSTVPVRRRRRRKRLHAALPIRKPHTATWTGLALNVLLVTSIFISGNSPELTSSSN